MKASSITRKHSGPQWNAVISVCLDARIVILALRTISALDLRLNSLAYSDDGDLMLVGMGGV